MSQYVAPDRLRQTLLARLPGLLLDVADLEINNTVQEFILMTRAWREEIVQDLKLNEVLYDLTTDQFSDLAYVLSVRSHDTEGDPDLPDKSSGRGLRWTMRNVGTIELGSAPTRDIKDGLRVWVSLRAKETTKQIPDLIHNYYFEALLDGTLSRLYATPAKPYTDTTLATYHGRRFRDGMARAKTEVDRQFGVRQPQWAFPDGFAKGISRGVSISNNRRRVSS